MKKIALFNYKGGVGKTVSVLNIGFVLAKAGKKILLVDMDAQASLSSTFKANNLDRKTIGHLLLDIDENENIDEVIVKTEMENIDLLPANYQLTETEEEILRDKYNAFNDRLRNVLDRIEEGGYDYDYCIIDCPPVDNLMSRNVLVASDEVIIPMKAGKYAYDGIGRLVTEINKIKRRLNPDLTFKASFITMEEKQTNVNKVIKELTEDKLGSKLAKTTIRKNTTLEEAVMMNMSVIEYDENANSSQDYISLVKELFNVEI